LHPENILLREDNWNHKLEVYLSNLDLCVNTYKVGQQSEIFGIIPYISPEVFKERIPSIKSDIYSLGIIMWELASGDNPFSGYNHDAFLIRKIVDGLRPKYVIRTPKCYHELMQKCLDADPEKRPTTRDLLNELHTFTTTLKKQQFEAADRKIRGRLTK
jgi:serine/threonine protein kinase